MAILTAEYLDERISNLKNEISETEREVGQVFISIHGVKCPKDFSKINIDEIWQRVKSFERLDHLIDKHKTDTLRLNDLLEAKSILCESETKVCVN